VSGAGEVVCDRCGSTPAIVQTFCGVCGPVPLCGDCTTAHIVELETPEAMTDKVYCAACAHPIVYDDAFGWLHEDFAPTGASFRHFARPAEVRS